MPKIENVEKPVQNAAPSAAASPSRKTGQADSAPPTSLSQRNVTATDIPALTRDNIKTLFADFAKKTPEEKGKLIEKGLRMYLAEPDVKIRDEHADALKDATRWSSDLVGQVLNTNLPIMEMLESVDFDFDKLSLHRKCLIKLYDYARVKAYIDPEHYQMEDMLKIMDEMGSGNCAGFSLFWAQLNLLGRGAEFTDHMTALIEWNSTAENLTTDREEKIETLMSLVRFYQVKDSTNMGEYYQAHGGDAAQYAEESLLDNPTKYQVPLHGESLFTQDSLIAVLPIILKEGNVIRFGGNQHAIAFKQEGAQFKIFDINYKTDDPGYSLENSACIVKSIEELAEAIIDRLYTDLDRRHGRSSTPPYDCRLTVLDTATTHNTYPTQSEMFETLLLNRVDVDYLINVVLFVLSQKEPDEPTIGEHELGVYKAEKLALIGKCFDKIGYDDISTFSFIFDGIGIENPDELLALLEQDKRTQLYQHEFKWQDWMPSCLIGLRKIKTHHFLDKAEGKQYLTRFFDAIPPEKIKLEDIQSIAGGQFGENQTHVKALLLEKGFEADAVDKALAAAETSP